MERATADARAPLRLGLVGCSWFARTAHLPALRTLCAPSSPTFRLVALTSATNKSMAKAEAAYGHKLTRHATMEALFADPQVDAVLLVLPIPLVADAVEAALRAGKHVLSEKPLAASLDRALEALAVHREEAPHLAWAVCENWPRKPSVEWMRSQLQQGAIGAVVSARCELLDGSEATGGAADDWRARGEYEGGVLLDNGVHWIRLLRHLLGEPIVASATTCSLGGGAPNVLHAWIRLEHCATAATLALGFAPSSARKRGARQRRQIGPPDAALTLVGATGTIRWWPTHQSSEGLARVSLERVDGEPLEVVLRDDWVCGGVEATLRDALSWVAEVAGKWRPSATNPPEVAEPACTADDALRDMVLVSALLRSARGGGGAVSIANMLDDGARAVECGHTLPILPNRAVGDASHWRAPTRPSITIRCLGERDALSAVRLAQTYGHPLRAVGRGHSWSGAADSRDAVRLECAGGMCRVLGIDVASRRVCVQPGIALFELRRVLAANGLTLGSWPMLHAQTVGGAVSTGSHGSGRDGTLSDLVVGARLVMPGPTIRECGECGVGRDGARTRAENGDTASGETGAPDEEEAHEWNELLMRGARLSLGLLGVMTEITLQCEPAYRVRRHVHTCQVDGFAQRSPALLAAYRHVWALWRVGARTLSVCGLESVGEAPAVGAHPYDGRNWWRGEPRFEAPQLEASELEALESGAPESETGDTLAAAGGTAFHAGRCTASASKGDDPGADAGQATTIGRCESAPWLSMEYSIPASRLDEAMGRVGRLEPLRGRVIELKYVGHRPRSTLLGANIHTDVVAFNIFWEAASPETEAAARVLERELSSLDGLPHLGKWSSLRMDTLEVEEMGKLVATLDPDGVFFAEDSPVARWSGNVVGCRNQ